MSRFCVIGSSSTVAKHVISSLVKMPVYDVVKVGRDEDDHIKININHSNFMSEVDNIPLDLDYYLIALGYLIPKRMCEQSKVEVLDSVTINLLFSVLLCEKILDVNKSARILLLGSESGQKGSYDTSYFVSKAGLSQYVKEKHVKFPSQQIVMVSPSLIEDTKMTQERQDLDEVLKQANSLPKKRYLMASEVAELILFLLLSDKGYINNEVIEMNGGKFARMRW
jgi:NAD(P)-dependent dehydrogenase (short-subunit alcohol dehydrogenase family)